MFSEQNYSESRYHFLHSSDGEGCAQMLVEYSSTRGFRSEVDMFVVQAVLQYVQEGTHFHFISHCKKQGLKYLNLQYLPFPPPPGSSA